jgi:hypothetical protein
MPYGVKKIDCDENISKITSFLLIAHDMSQLREQMAPVSISSINKVHSAGKRSGSAKRLGASPAQALCLYVQQHRVHSSYTSMRAKIYCPF